MIRKRYLGLLAIVALGGYTTARASSGAAPRAADFAPINQPLPNPIVYPANAAIPAVPILVGRGVYNVQSLILLADPLVADPTLGPPPTQLVVATVRPGAAKPVARVGDTIKVSYQLLSWQSGEVVDATPGASKPSIVLGGAAIAPAISKVLEGTTPGQTLLALFPAGTAGLPSYIPDDVAYLLVAEVTKVVRA